MGVGHVFFNGLLYENAHLFRPLLWELVKNNPA